MNCSNFNSVDDLTFLFIRADQKWLDPCCCDCQTHKNEGFLVGHCLPLTLEEANNFVNNVSHLLRALNTLNRMTAILCQFSWPLPAYRQSKILEFCIDLLDFPADSIGFQAVTILGNLFKLHRLDCANSCSFQSDSSAKNSSNYFCDWSLSIGKRLIPTIETKIISKQTAKTMHILLHSNPELRPKLMTEEIVKNLYKQMENTSIDAQISHLIVSDICASLSNRNCSNGRIQFHLELIKQQLLNKNTNSNARKTVENKLFPILLRSPESKAWFLGEFDSFIDFPHLSSPHSQRALCFLLRLAIQHSNGYRNDCSLHWLDLLKEEENAEQIMRQTLESADFETRLSAWSLLCSHPKSSQPVFPIEIRLAQQFLPSNLHLKSPSARQAIFTQLDKLITRIREHSKSLLKTLTKNGCQTNSEEHRQIQSYRNFFHWLHQLAFKNIAAPDWHQNLMANLSIQQNENGINFVENGQENDNEEEENEDEEEEEGNIPFCTRISALTLLEKLYLSILIEEDPFSMHIQIWEWIGQNEWQKLLQGLDDRYEVCQEIALKLLNKFWSNQMRKYSMEIKITEEEWILLDTAPFMPRHQQAIEYRLRFLLPKLDFNDKNDFILKLIGKIDIKCGIMRKGNQNDLLALIQSPQLHALMAALQTALPFVELDFGKKEPLLDRIISLCHFCAELISPVVHSMSPEGYLPKNDQILDESSFICAQQLARTCFRAHRAISEIFAEIIREMPNSTSLTDEQLNRIGFKYFWKQLTECRHRGAFEAAAESFQIVCRRFWEFSEERDDFPCNPAKWIHQIMGALMGQNVEHRFCVTRRSAGLPHLVSTILATNLDANSLSTQFNSTIGQLLKCRDLDEPELEVHCVNILRLLFVNSKFSELVLPHVELALHSTLDGLTSEIWPIRNAYTQLFAALIKRVFGTPANQQRSLHIHPKCKLSAHEFFTRHPSLFDLLMEHLAEIAAALEAKTFGCRHFLLTFPLLIIFTHLRPVPHVQENFPLHPFLPNLICLLLSFPARQQRELASAAILSISTRNQLERILDWLSLTSFNCNQNFIDGVHIFASQIEELEASAENVWKLKEWLINARKQSKIVDLNLINRN